MILRKLLSILLLSGVLSGFLPGSFAVPEAKAIDPVTMAILTPVAIKGAQIAAPYVLKGLANMGKAFLKVFPDFLSLLGLPAGMMLAIFGGPFGYFHKGLVWMGKGCIAPFKLCFHMLMVPVGIFGIGVS